MGPAEHRCGQPNTTETLGTPVLPRAEDTDVWIYIMYDYTSAHIQTTLQLMEDLGVISVCVNNQWWGQTHWVLWRVL